MVDVDAADSDVNYCFSYYGNAIAKVKGYQGGEGDEGWKTESHYWSNAGDYILGMEKIKTCDWAEIWQRGFHAEE